MKFDKETIIGLGFCLLLMLAWPTISQALGWSAVEEEIVRETVAAPVQTQPAAETPAAAAPAVKTVQPSVPLPAGTKAADGKFGNDFLDLTADAQKGAIREIRFLKYRHNLDDRQIAISDTDLFALEVPGAVLVSAADAAVKDDLLATSRKISLNGCDLRVDQVFSIKDEYIIQCRTVITNLSNHPAIIKGAVVRGAAIAPWHTVSGDKMRTMSHRLDILTAGNDIEDIDGDEDDEDFYSQQNQEVKWASVSNKYFCSLIRRNDGNNFHLALAPRTVITDDKGKEFNIISAGMALPLITLAPNGSEVLDIACYTGPKKGDTLAAFAQDGDKVMHLAWGPINYLARFLMWILNLLYSLCGSYGVSIIILTLLVRSVFYPLTSRGNESMRKMQKVQPLFKELKEKYKNDPQLLNQKMAELYRKEGINPLAGCLPILLQIPIFFALYAMLDNAIALRHVSFLWCKNLAAADTVFSIPLGFELPFFNISSLPVNPLVLMMTLLMVIQQRMTPMAADPAQKKMMAMMPIIMLIFLYDLPSGLTLYWTISNFFSIIQLWLQKRRNQALQDAAQSK